FASLRPSASAEPRGSGLFVSGVGDKSLPVPGHRCCCAFVSRRATRVPFRTRLGSMVRVLPLCSCVRGLSLACLLVVGLCGGCGRLAGCWVGVWWWGVVVGALGFVWGRGVGVVVAGLAPVFLRSWFVSGLPLGGWPLWWRWAACWLLGGGLVVGGAGGCSGVCVGSRGWGGGGCFWPRGVLVGEGCVVGCWWYL